MNEPVRQEETIITARDLRARHSALARSAFWEAIAALEAAEARVAELVEVLDRVIEVLAAALQPQTREAEARDETEVIDP